MRISSVWSGREGQGERGGEIGRRGGAGAEVEVEVPSREGRETVPFLGEIGGRAEGVVEREVERDERAVFGFEGGREADDSSA